MKKVLLILGAVLLGIVLVIGGCKVQEKSQKEQMLEIVKSDEAKEVYRSDLKYIDSNAFTTKGIIQSYKIKSFESNPMGGIIVYLYVNNNEDYTVSVFLHKNQQTGKLESGGGSWSQKLDRLVKEKKHE
ncbi:DUF1310 family protein [Streptococcus intermedius]|uniref:DUF1310 family protein n=1 Tax=Streptococcus intermedius TaxID=1338 RepID=UPI000E3CFC2B|nr:DUF1310 family protein [Streptococcus intermedius]MDK8091800.1 DUF1310 family protein [Streptococcus intermedius]